MWIRTGAAWSRPDALKPTAVETSFASRQPASPATWSVTTIPATARRATIVGKLAGLAAGRSEVRVPQPARSRARRPMRSRDMARGYHWLGPAAARAPGGPTYRRIGVPRALVDGPTVEPIRRVP